MTTANSIRQLYLKFFEKHGHAVVPSANLVPENDPTTLFTGSGMQPMVPYLLGEPHPKGQRITDSQKSFRSQDIEEVGDNRHTTFFEMLGNWSLGDYFKKEQLPWIFEFLTKEVGLAPDKLYVTVFRGNEELQIPRDEESAQIWQELFSIVGIQAEIKDFAEEKGMQQGRIFYYDETKNWWSRAGEPSKMPAGEPGGPDSEVFFDFGADKKLHESSAFKDQPCHVNCDCGRFLEIGNSVFMQYQKQDDGTFTELPQKNVDFGGGLERIQAAKNNDPDVFQIDLFKPIISELEKMSGQSYDSSSDTQKAFRVIADHVRAAVMLAADGVYPSNKEQGYFSRRLLRRSIRYGKMIGITEHFLAHLVPIVSNLYAEAYPEVKSHQAQIEQAFVQEEEKFNKTVEKGLKELERIFQSSNNTEPKLTVEQAFNIYQSYGFPLELTKEIAAQKGMKLESADSFDEQFESRRHQHSTQSRTASAGMFKGGLQDASETTVKYHTATHLLHAALRKVLGSHVQQKGSNITQDRLRFDFSHPNAVTTEEQSQIMKLISDWIAADLPVHKQAMSKSQALESGAIAFFIEKYPDEVTVYTIGKDPDTDWISKELCGGPHVGHTGEIGQLQWLKEQAVSAGVRRVYLQLSSL